jgi:four helix bundle protein
MDRYRSLEVWQVARQVSLSVLKQTDEHYHPRARGFFDQLRRSAVSIELNIVEGYALKTMGQFRRGLTIALGSAAETECVLELAAARGYLPASASVGLHKLVTTVMRLLFGILRTIHDK